MLIPSDFSNEVTKSLTNPKGLYIIYSLEVNKHSKKANKYVANQFNQNSRVSCQEYFR